MRFAKGHGTGNDFLILPDPDDGTVLPPDLVARLCDRRTGLGADGILRAVRAPAERNSNARAMIEWPPNDSFHVRKPPEISAVSCSQSCVCAASCARAAGLALDCEGRAERHGFRGTGS